MKTKLLMTIEQMQDRKKWLDVRNKGIGGSDAAVILGMNPWKSAFQLWMEKTGQIEPEDLSDNERVYWGTVMEEIVAKRFEELTGKKVRRCGMLQGEPEFLLANVDRLVVGEDAGLECKTTSTFNKEQWDGDEIPDAYYLQCQHYMMVTGFKTWYIACLIGGQKFVWKEVPRNEQDIRAMFKAECEFWKQVQDKTMPPVDGSEECAKALSRKFPGREKDEVMLDKDADGKIQQLVQVKGLADELIKQKNLLENELKTMLGNAEIGHATKFDVRWTIIKGKSGIDSKKLKEEQPKIFAKYFKIGQPSRRMSIKEIKEEK